MFYVRYIYKRIVTFCHVAYIHKLGQKVYKLTVAKLLAKPKREPKYKELCSPEEEIACLLTNPNFEFEGTPKLEVGMPVYYDSVTELIGKESGENRFFIGYIKSIRPRHNKRSYYTIRIEDACQKE